MIGFARARFGFVMGSTGRFDPLLCRCGRSILRCYPDSPWICWECEVVCRCKFLDRILRQVLPHRELDPYSVRVIAAFSAPYLTLRRRLHFLRMVLLGRDSCFRPLTYFHGRLAGSISQTEDILDRLFSFFVGTL